ncbi:hypothetical protein D9M73_151450 [compost metagenome]
MVVAGQRGTQESCQRRVAVGPDRVGDGDDRARPPRECVAQCLRLVDAQRIRLARRTEMRGEGEARHPARVAELIISNRPLVDEQAARRHIAWQCGDDIRSINALDRADFGRDDDRVK